MRHLFRNALGVLALIGLTGVASAQDADVEGAADHPLLARYDGAVIRGYREATLDEYQLLVAPGADEIATDTIQGHVWWIAYGNPDTASIFGVTQYYLDLLEQAGFEIILDCETDECGGLNFAYAVETLNLPAMQFDPANYHYIAASLAGDPKSVAVIFVSDYNAQVFTEVNVIELGD
jgi:OmpA-OmpF porin, OOP family